MDLFRTARVDLCTYALRNGKILGAHLALLTCPDSSDHG